MKLSRTFLIADTHFDHRNVILYENRPWPTVQEMNEEIIKRWNAIVKPEDRVYHLGDVSMNRNGLLLAARLNGRKVLIKGNHDNQKLKDYLPIFDDIRGVHKLNNFILSHVPVHPDQKYRFSGNIHGHLHGKNVLLPDGSIDPWYISVSVEHINFTPITFEQLEKRFYERSHNELG